MLRHGTGEPVVLLHGVTSSERIWRAVASHLTDHYEVIAFTALGHRGGPDAPPGIGVADIVDHAERTLDELGLDRPHLAGNSLGGWVALELARRGRAASVCALSPGGTWDSERGRRRALAKIRWGARLARITRWMLPFLARFAFVRRIGLRDGAAQGDRLSPEQFIEFVDDILGCGARHDLLRMTDGLAPLETAPCPITLAWSEHDRLLPVATDGERARQLIPDAEWRVLPGVGHVPMIDDPELVAATIRASASRAST
jgi:pimeloyl-ACP methyl ester carboxylesterase